MEMIKSLFNKNLLQKNYNYPIFNINQNVSYVDTQNAQPINVMSFNMKRNYTSFGQNSWKNRVELIVEMIQSQQPDVVGTQELTSKSLDDLKTLLPDYHVVGQGRGGNVKGEFAAVFFRKDKFDLKEDETFWLSSTPNKPSRAWFAICPRICTTCTLTLKGNPQKTIHVFNTHLDHISSISRINSLRLISKRIEEKYLQENASILLMGDFNAKPQSKTLRTWYQELALKPNFSFQNAYASFNQNEIGRSFHGFKGKTNGLPIDYIFASNTLNLLRVSICRDNKNNHYPSDHYPVLAQYMLSF